MADRRMSVPLLQGLCVASAMGLAALVMGRTAEPAPDPDPDPDPGSGSGSGPSMQTSADDGSSRSAPTWARARVQGRAADHGAAPRALGPWRAGSTTSAPLDCPAPRSAEVTAEVTGEATAGMQPPPLFDAEGLPMPPLASALPTRGDAFTRQGLYATEAQMAWEELVVGPYTVVVEVASASAAASAIERALVIHHSQALPSAMAYFVRADDPALAAQVADCLADAALPAVFVVTRQRGR